MTVGTTILEQLGGGRFIAMTGASLFTTRGDGLTFRLPSGSASHGINCVRVTLEASDLYKIEFIKLRGIKITPISENEGVQAEALRRIFTAQTGLYVSL